ncbi:MAG: PilZ domain-containing protein [Gammaproteobacteria bacterium]|nr:PilZ domain-containing protein [Gammaproteobacteria bacterium]MBU4500310.1 PilZ domain-containing protein [Gammaproteobacteria bacterium]
MLPLERRAHPRYPFLSKARMICPEVTYPGTLIDISIYGALFYASFIGNAVPGTRCMLQVLSLKEDMLFQVNGAIAHTGQSLVGIEFAPLDHALQSRIRQITLFNLAPSGHAERELPALLKPKPTTPSDSERINRSQ